LESQVNRGLMPEMYAGYGASACVQRTALELWSDC
jgi:hypothetical protein